MAAREPRPGGPDGDEPAIFGGSNGLWITLATLAALIAALTIWIAALSLGGDGGDAALGVVLKGGLVAGAVALAAWFAASQRREVVLDREGITIRSVDGRVRQRRAWREVASVEARRLPGPLPGSGPLGPPGGGGASRQLLTQVGRPTVLINCTDGSALLLDPQQVRDTAALIREAERRRQAPRQGRERR